MKQPKKLTRAQKEFLDKKGKDPSNYMFHKEDDSYLYFYNRKTSSIERVEK